ncbi:nucleotidyltransferase family protein [Mucilaginibacter boryungensis]|uniref:Nucleotidyltransferase n=1 Tax=Mucilaginibacter boryungensis TaxID=768480 RepID=A0ABR9XLX5_9SPHI|nr:nucleotidyltransferase [Mucilaginibacter boryungensis]MBE9668094.1 nucleotidyltransferase [Mucilaginibacter boryungensis]
MATTVNAAFDIFLKDAVRLDPARSDTAKTSKTSLVDEIIKFPGDGLFPLLHPDLSIDYGSFSRKTKIRPLNDIDLMIILHAQGSSYYEYPDRIEITVSASATTLSALCNDGTYILNSKKVNNKFKDYLGNVPKYEKAEIKRNLEAVTLKLVSYEWVYDIVPCFITNPDAAGRTFYLIPDGQGNWKKTDPRIDKARTIAVNQAQTISVLDVIRIIKYWTSRPTMPTIKSYFLENLILNYYGTVDKSQGYIDVEIPKLLASIYHSIESPFNDPKGFQGDINHLSYEERVKVKERAAIDYNRAIEAGKLEGAGKMKEAIEKWGEIFGGQFPTYS